MNAMQIASELALYAVVAVAVVQDVRTAKISNRLIFTGLILSLMFRIWLGGTSQILLFLGNIIFPVILLYLFYLFGILGAGDIKLFSVIGGFTNLTTLWHCIVISFLAGAVLSVAQMLYHRNLFRSIRLGLEFVLQIMQGKIMSYQSYGVEDRNIMHFSVAILIGLCVAKQMFGG